MTYTSKILEEAITAVSSLPSIGKKSALRLVLHLINDDSDKAEKLIKAIHALKHELQECPKCHNYTDTGLCAICDSVTRDKSTLCVIESVRDLMAIEETGQFKGLFHIIGGVISPIDGIGPSDLNIDDLVDRVRNEDVKEVIMAISPTIEGETTIYYMTKKLKPLGVTVSTIARGVSFGGDLEYADELTLGRSIVSRIPYTI